MRARHLSFLTFLFFIFSVFDVTTSYARAATSEAHFSYNTNSYNTNKEKPTPFISLIADTLPPLTLNVNAIPEAESTISQLKPLPYSRQQNWWFTRLKRGTLHLNDTSIVYPKFLKFCLNVYNWGDHFFNGYDPEYVEGTGKRWKARVVSDNWVDSYLMAMPKHMNIHMLSDLYANIGAYIQYMAVSMGYTYDMSNIFGNNSMNHQKWEYGFNCARFDASIYYQENTGGTFLRNFGKYKKGRFFKEKFPGLELYNFGVDFLYFINNKRYSHGAAYNFSKFQKKSQGSLIVGISYSNIKIGMDFSQLPEVLLPYLTIPATDYLFHYRSLAAVIGYGFNCVITPRLLFNVTILPSIGLTHCYEDSLEGEKKMLSLNVASRMSLTYNINNFFFGLIGKQNGHWYKSNTYSLFSSIENFSGNIGIRF